MCFNRKIKNVIWSSVINYNNFKLLHDTVILKNKKKNKELIFFVIIRYFLKNKKGFLFLLVVRDKVGADCEKKPSI
jgi:hypothetical protein